MGRPLTGSVRYHRNRWWASVPTRGGARRDRHTGAERRLEQLQHPGARRPRQGRGGALGVEPHRRFVPVDGAVEVHDEQRLARCGRVRSVPGVRDPGVRVPGVLDPGVLDPGVLSHARLPPPTARPG